MTINDNEESYNTLQASSWHIRFAKLAVQPPVLLRPLRPGKEITF